MRKWLALMGSAATLGLAGWALESPAQPRAADEHQHSAINADGSTHCVLEEAGDAAHRRKMASPTYRDAFAKYSSLLAQRPSHITVPKDESDPSAGTVKVPNSPPTACFAEGTSPEVVEAFLNAMRSAPDGAWTFGDDREYQLNNRWTFSGSTGDPITIYWSLVPDGTSWDGANSNLFAQMDAKFASVGGRAAWIAAIEDSFARWEYLSGINFVRVQFAGQPWDDGAAFGNGYLPNFRGHMRIGMNAIDGASNVLAYNYYPQNGDMKLDSAENWGSSANNFRFLRNVVMHEAGHGLGFRHVCSDDTGQLMEPFLSTSFDGPQHDDMRIVQRNYGDAFEPNDTSGDAYDIGDFTWGASGSRSSTFGADGDGVNLASRRGIFGDGDVDYLKFTVTKPSVMTITVRPIGLTYDDNAQAGDGSCPSGTNTNSLNRADLEVQLRDATNLIVLDSATSNPAGSNETIVYTAVPGTYHIRIYESGTPTQSQLYLMDLRSETTNDPPVITTITDKSINEMVAWSFDVNASDPEGNTITYSLTTAPSGMTINSSTGLISWTPTETQGPGSYTVTVRATDNGDPNLSDSDTFIVNVLEVNRAPVLTFIPNQTVDEGTLLTIDANATDPDSPSNTLTYTLSGAPSGMSINMSTGVINWTPSEAQGPLVEVVTVQVRDNGSPQLFDTQDVTITVKEVNRPPVLTGILPQTVDEGTELLFDADATDPDDPTNLLTYSLSGAPAGMTVNALTGEIKWTPSESAGPGVFNVTVIVKDNGSPQLQDSQNVQITVKEVNKAPVLDAIGNKTIDEQTLLTFTATASDPDLPANTLKFSLVGAPLGATIDASTGVFSWTPNESQGPQVHTFTVRVEDDGNPALNDTETISVRVNEVNRAPVLGAIGNKTVQEETLLTFTATATDPDLPANTLTYGLIGAPAGASIHPASGVFTWTPTEAQGPGSYTFTIIVIDNGSPSLNDTETITVTVNESQKRIKGKVDLQDFIGDVTSIPVTFEIRDVGSLTVLDTYTTNLASDGTYSVTITSGLVAGKYDVAAKGTHWLRRLRSVVSLDAFGASGVDFVLVNGDVDGDNVVTVFDYNALSDAFDSSAGDPNWNPNADLDGDGSVTVFDYNILSTNFDQVGDD